MSGKEAKARIKINKLLEEVGWRFFDSAEGKANISLEHRTKKGKFTGEMLGNDLENAPDGFVDYLLLNEQNRPVALVEAKRENIDPLTAKIQTREYAVGRIFAMFSSPTAMCITTGISKREIRRLFPVFFPWPI